MNYNANPFINNPNRNHHYKSDKSRNYQSKRHQKSADVPNPFLAVDTTEVMEDIRLFKLSVSDQPKSTKPDDIQTQPKSECTNKDDDHQNDQNEQEHDHENEQQYDHDQPESESDECIEQMYQEFTKFEDAFECSDDGGRDDKSKTESSPFKHEEVLQDHSSMEDMDGALKINSENINELSENDKVLLLSNNKTDFLILSFVQISKSDQTVQFKDSYNGTKDYIYWLNDLPLIFKTTTTTTTTTTTNQENETNATNQNNETNATNQTSNNNNNNFNNKSQAQLDNCMNGNDIEDYKVNTKLYLETDEQGYGCYVIQGFDSKTTKCVLKSVDDNLVICYLRNTKHTFGRKSCALPIEK